MYIIYDHIYIYDLINQQEIEDYQLNHYVFWLLFPDILCYNSFRSPSAKPIWWGLLSFQIHYSQPILCNISVFVLLVIVIIILVKAEVGNDSGSNLWS